MSSSATGVLSDPRSLHFTTLTMSGVLYSFVVLLNHRRMSNGFRPFTSAAADRCEHRNSISCQLDDLLLFQEVRRRVHPSASNSITLSPIDEFLSPTRTDFESLWWFNRICIRLNSCSIEWIKSETNCSRRTIISVMDRCLLLFFANSLSCSRSCFSSPSFDTVGLNNRWMNSSASFDIFSSGWNTRTTNCITVFTQTEIIWRAMKKKLIDETNVRNSWKIIFNCQWKSVIFSNDGLKSTKRFEHGHVPSGIRLLAQEPLENVISFICSSNNNVQRITKMIQVLCQQYGTAIGTLNNVDYYQFPTIGLMFFVLERTSTRSAICICRSTRSRRSGRKSPNYPVRLSRPIHSTGSSVSETHRERLDLFRSTEKSAGQRRASWTVENHGCRKKSIGLSFRVARLSWREVFRSLIVFSSCHLVNKMLCLSIHTSTRLPWHIMDMGKSGN